MKTTQNPVMQSLIARRKNEIAWFEEQLHSEKYSSLLEIAITKQILNELRLTQTACKRFVGKKK